MREYMCRIFYSPPNSLEFEEEDLWEFFNRLERVGGGDGNGVYLIEEGIVEKCHEKMPLWASLKGGMLFHTRKATHGNVADYNTQPVVGNRYVLCHNGIFNEVNKSAVLLGVYQEDKYSDSYKMHQIIEKVGILNFYIAFKDDSFGVVLVYDKKLNKTYLLKSSGSFTVGRMSNRWIYASSELGYWSLDKGKDEKDIVYDFGNGLYLLEGKSFVRLHKLEKKYKHYNYYGNTTYYGGHYGNNWYNNKKKSKKRSKTKTKIVTREKAIAIAKKLSEERKPKEPEAVLCEWCDKVFEDNEETFVVEEMTICYDCYQYVEEAETRYKLQDHCEACQLDIGDDEPKHLVEGHTYCQDCFDGLIDDSEPYSFTRHILFHSSRNHGSNALLYMSSRI